MAGDTYESIAQVHRAARRRLPRSVYKAILAGTDRGVTLRDNVDAFAEIGLAPHVVGLMSEPDLSTTIMGQPSSMPVMIAPTGVQAVHPDGELAVARAAASQEIPMGLSAFGSKPIEQVVEANPQTFFQMYWAGSKDDVEHRMKRAAEAGAIGLIVTLDWTFAHSRDWGSPEIPAAMNLRTVLKHAPETILGGKFRYLGRYARRLRPPSLTVPNMRIPDEDAPTFFGAYGEWMQTPQPTWEDIAWLRDQWDGPLMVKGVMRVDDARAAVDAGVDAISVSNHGGNNLDGTPASIRALPAIVEAVGDDVEVLLDGGVRRGSDVLKAVAIGARAVLIGRAYLWGLAADGQAGVEDVLAILRHGLTTALMGLRKASVSELSLEDLIIPPDFGRSLGGEQGHVYGGPHALHEAQN